MGTRHRGGIGFSYRPARLHRLAEFIPWHQFRGLINIFISTGSEPVFLNLHGAQESIPRNECSLAGRYDNPIPPKFLAPIDFLKIPAQESNPPDWESIPGLLKDLQIRAQDNPR
jgi:hypothetical protein